MKKEIENTFTVEKREIPTIDLGCANEWNSAEFALYSKIKELTLPDTLSAELGMSSNRYDFKIKIEGVEYVVTYTVESGD